MTPKLQISSHVLKRLEKVTTQCSGCLFGVWYKGTLLILGFNIESTSGDSTATDSLQFKHLQNGFPAELDLCGLVKFGLCTDAEAHLQDILQDVDVTDNPIVLHCELGTIVGLRASLFKHGQLEQIPFEVVDEQTLRNEFLYTRLACQLEIRCTEDGQSVKAALQQLRIHLASGRTGFNVKQTGIYLLGGGPTGTTLSGCKPNARISDLMDAVTAAADEATNTPVADDGFGVANAKPDKKKKKPSAASVDRLEYDILPIGLLLKVSTERAPELTDPFAEAGDSPNDQLDAADDADAPGIAFHMQFDPEPLNRLRVPLLVTSLALLHRQTEALALYDILIEGLCRSIRLVECSVADAAFVERHAALGSPCTYNFLPAELGHFFGCVYFARADDTDEYALRQRRRLHRTFGLPVRRPHFRKANRHRFADEPRTDAYLVNPHAGVQRPLRDGQLSVVQGRYTYYHYMQDGFNDSGWGCAYRSLQTLCSWFRWQGYSETPVPDHRAIQAYLVRIGDKPHTFVGSRQWIGSMEVSMCLDGFMGVQCRIMRVDSGADLAEHGPTLRRHFDTHGTPIMIGGGVLAHTILGVDHDSNTGELQFLVLDPHYTGADDVRTVLAKRWCAWKGTDFWDKKSYYNLCMPQLPAGECC